MKLINQIRFGIRILLDLAMHQQGGVVKMSDIAARQKTSLKYLEQIIRPFKEAGFVTSRRGRNGGYCLARNPKTISLAQIICIFEKRNAFNNYGKEMSTSGCSDHQDFLIREAWDEARQAFYNRLEKISLADLSMGTTKKLWGNSDLLIFI
jgi:Rrf2 family protein